MARFRPIKSRSAINTVKSAFQSIVTPKSRSASASFTSTTKQSQKGSNTHQDNPTRPIRPIIQFPHKRFPRLYRLWLNVDWRGKVVGVLCLAFLALVIMPTVSANMAHRKDTDLAREWVLSADASVPIKVYDMQTGHVNSIALNDYLVGVLAAEMKPDAPMDALQAAAVAARTYVVGALVQKGGSRPSFANQHGADITNNATLDLPWWSMAQQEDKFGKQFGVDTVRLQHAVLATDGLILTYKKEPILAFTFAQSAGQTRDGSKVFGKDLPYLKSVSCPADAKAPAKPPVNITLDQVKQALQIPGNTVKLSDFHIASRDAQGYVKAVKYKDRSWTGETFASALGLASSNFTWTVSKDGKALEVTCKGIGSGIGMSLHEAVAQADDGKGWQEITAYFYPGSQVEGDEQFTEG